MKTEPQCFDERTPTFEGQDGSFPLNVVLIYNDMHSALRGVQSLERLGKKFDGSLQPHLTPLPVEHLRDEGCYDQSLTEAVEADMIVISINGPGDLTPQLKAWLADYTRRREKTNHTAIIALLSSMGCLDELDSPRLRYLRNIARAAGMDFFSPDQQSVQSVVSSLEVVG